MAFGKNYSMIKVEKEIYLDLLKEKGKLLQQGQKASFNTVLKRLLSK